MKHLSWLLLIVQSSFAQLSQSYRGFELTLLSLEPVGLSEGPSKGLEFAIRTPDLVWTPQDTAYSRQNLRVLDGIEARTVGGRLSLLNRREGEIFVIARVRVAQKEKGSADPNEILLRDRQGRRYECLLAKVAFGASPVEVRELAFSVPINVYRGLALLNASGSFRLERLKALDIDESTFDLEQYIDAQASPPSGPEAIPRTSTTSYAEAKWTSVSKGSGRTDWPDSPPCGRSVSGCLSSAAHM